MVVVLAVTGGPQAIFLVVIRVTRHTLVGMDLFDVFQRRFGWRVLRIVCRVRWVIFSRLDSSYRSYHCAQPWYAMLMPLKPRVAEMLGSWGGRGYRGQDVGPGPCNVRSCLKSLIESALPYICSFVTASRRTISFLRLLAACNRGVSRRSQVWLAHGIASLAKDGNFVLGHVFSLR